MPIHFYIGRDLQNRASEPIFHQESNAIHRICRYLWIKYQQQEKAYALIANVQRIGTGQELSPDIVLISELGIGVVELKDNFGVINCQNPHGRWLAGPHPIMAYDKRANDASGKKKDHINPANQVRYYASCIRQDLLNTKHSQWFRGDTTYLNSIKINTAVCFSNPQAITGHCQKQIIANYPPGKVLAPWEVLSVITPAEIAEWVLNLRFDVQMGHADWYRPLRLFSSDVVMMAEEFFGGEAWHEMSVFMQSETVPYAYLKLLDNEGNSIFTYKLEQEEILIGRDPNACTLVIPGSYPLVSRKHARMLRTPDGVILEDVGSSHGILLNGMLVKDRVFVHSNAIITLGSSNNPNPCQLQFTKDPPPPPGPTAIAE